MKPQKIIKKFIVGLILSIIVVVQIELLEFKTEATTISSVQKNNSYSRAYILAKEIQEKSKTEKYKETEQFDLALRKVIVEVKDKQGNNKEIVNANKESSKRNIVIDKSNNTIQYRHRKDPVLVEKGDIIIYAITVYNEGKQDGYARKIVDQLPGSPTTGLRLLTTDSVTSSTGNKYSVEYITTTNTVTFTQESTKPKVIPAYNGTELSEETIVLECQVMADMNTKQSTILTNIAYISEEYNARTSQIIVNEGDKDSTPVEHPIFQKEDDTKQDGITYGKDIGYIGNTNNLLDLSQKNIYYKGQQDDDDFEKLIILPQAFDLSLRTVITEVDGIRTEEDRKIKVEGIENIDEEKQITTAQYNHIKTPVVVKNGSTVKYNINIYNEASIDGIAQVIKKQLPIGLELDIASLYTQLIDGKTQYYIITEKGNKYIVKYEKEINVITFTLDITAKTTNIEALSIRETIDLDTLEFDCTVNHIADENSNIYLTSIAYIQEEKKADGTIITNQERQDRDSEPYTRPQYTANQLNTINDIGYIGNQENQTDLGKKDTYYRGEQDDDDFEKLVILPQSFDLKLVKYVDTVNKDSAGNRIKNVDTSKLNTIGENGRKITTAEYEMEKNPMSVKALDLVKYTFRVYNEGDYDGYAEEISEDIPQGLEALMIGKDAVNGIIIYSWDGIELKDITEEIKLTDMYDEIVETNSIWGYNAETPIITTTALKDELIKAYGNNQYDGYADKENKIDYKEVSVIFRVKENAVASITPIRTEATITRDKAVDDNGEEIINLDGKKVTDRDSNPSEWKKIDLDKDYNEDKWEIYKEDDEDYDNIIIREFDLGLRTQVTNITRNGQEISNTERYAKLDLEALHRIEQRKIEQLNLQNKEIEEKAIDGEIKETGTEDILKPEQPEEKTIYNYYDVYTNKVKVRAGDIVTYSIRVYNEGEMSAYASLITKTLPSGLELLPYTEGDGSINDKYRWRQSEGTENIYETDYLSYKNDLNKETENSTIIKAYTGSGEADYKEVEIQCKVKTNVTKEDSLVSIAQISDDSDDKGNPIKDKDSTTGKENNEQNWQNEDDLDIEVLQLEEFDLTIRKFIEEVEKVSTEENISKDKDIEIEELQDRKPEIKYDKEKSQIITVQNKEPLQVDVNDIVIYTIRVYNEGEIDGYAQEITNDISEYLEFLPEHEINQKFEWKMYDKKGKETERVAKAVELKTNYLEKEENQNSTDKLLKAFTTNGKINRIIPDYKEIKVAFKVKDTNSSTYIINNKSKISDVADKDGNPVIDKDINIEGKNEDIENVQVKYFNLALSKYLTEIIITEDGNRSLISTGNIGDSNDIIPKVEIDKNKINETTVKLVYTIKIINDGNISGYVKKITDYIPDGLEFKLEDNPGWIDTGNGIALNSKLENLALQPGENSELEIVLTWKKSGNNIGAKINKAEISECYNDEKILVEYSDTNDQKSNENHVGTAEVIISIKTGGGVNQQYIYLTTILCFIILLAVILIKIFVL